MNILFDIRTLLDERYSGVSEYVRLLLTNLLEVDTQNQYFLFYNSARDFSGRLPVFRQSNVHVVYTRLPNKIFNYLFLKIFGRPYFDRLAKRQTGQSIDLFFMPHLNFAAWSPEVKSVLAVHDLSFYYFPEFFNWRKNLWHRLLNVKKLVKRFDRVVAFTENSADDIVSLSHMQRERLSVIPSGLEAGFKPLLKNDPELLRVRGKYALPERFILSLSTVEPRKNIEALIEAFDLLKSKESKRADRGVTSLKLVIAGGRGWSSASMYRRAESSPYARDIIFLDYVEAGDRVYLYNAAEVFAFPSFYEGFGFPPLEAMACGTPVVAATSSCLPEIAGEGALMIDPYNSAALAEALQTILEDDILAQKLRAAGLRTAEKFRWKKTALAYLDLFQELGQ